MQYIEIDFNTIEVHIDLASSTDPVAYLAGCVAPGDTLDQLIEDIVVTALGERLAEVAGRDLTIRVKTPPVKIPPLVAVMTTIPF